MCGALLCFMPQAVQVGDLHAPSRRCSSGVRRYPVREDENRKYSQRRLKSQEGKNSMDIKTILGSNYREGMTAEELIAALEAAEVPTEQQLRDSITKATKENAEKKRELKAKDGTIEELQNQLAALQRENAIGKYTSSFLSLGYGQEGAALAATALADGDAAALLEQQKQFQEAWMAAQKAELMRNTPAPVPGAANYQPGSMTKEAFARLTLAEKQQFATEHQEEYQTMYSEQ